MAQYFVDLDDHLAKQIFGDSESRCAYFRLEHDKSVWIVDRDGSERLTHAIDEAGRRGGDTFHQVSQEVALRRVRRRPAARAEPGSDKPQTGDDPW